MQRFCSCPLLLLRSTASSIGEACFLLTLDPKPKIGRSLELTLQQYIIFSPILLLLPGLARTFAATPSAIFVAKAGAYTRCDSSWPFADSHLFCSRRGFFWSASMLGRNQQKKSRKDPAYFRKSLTLKDTSDRDVTDFHV